MIRLWRGWVARCAVREDPIALALVRVLLSAVVVWELTIVGWLGLPSLLWAPIEAGGVVDLARLTRVPSVARLFPLEHAAAWGQPLAWTLYFGALSSALAFGAGWSTRLSGLTFVLIYAQTELLNDTADRAIDRLIRIVVLVLVFSASGSRLSIDAWRRTGSPLGSGATAPAWPRYFLVFQLTVVYVVAGLEKFAVAWFPWGGSSALYQILQDPMMARFDFSGLAHPAVYPITQIATSSSHLWEWTFWMVPLALYFQATRHRPGRLRAACNALDVRMIYVVFGVAFHLALVLTLRLGIFPTAILAIYPVFFHPKALLAIGRRLPRRVTPGGEGRSGG